MLSSALAFVSIQGWAAAIAVALIAGIVHGYSGFGGALLMVPILSLFIEPAHAVAATIVSAFVGQLRLAYQAGRMAHWGECGPFVIGGTILMPAGIAILMTSDTHVVRRLVGLSTLIASCILLTGWAYRGRRTSAAAAFFGGLSGIINGVTGQGGPLAVAYFIAAPTDADAQRANIIAVIFVMIIASLVLLILTGIVTPAVFIFGLALSVPHATGIWAGNRLFSLIPKQNYKRLTILLLMVAGVIALIK